MDFGTLMSIFIGVILVNNFVLSRFLGLCPYIGVSRDSSSALGMGMAVVFVMTMSSAATWFVYNYVLLPNENNVLYLLSRKVFPGVSPESFDLSYLETITFILVIALLSFMLTSFSSLENLFTFIPSGSCKRKFLFASEYESDFKGSPCGLCSVIISCP